MNQTGLPEPGANERLVIPYDELSPSIFDLVTAMDGLCSPIWLVDLSSPAMRKPARLLARLGPLADASGYSAATISEALKQHRPTAVVDFNGRMTVCLAEVAQQLGLEFPTPDIARSLIDKKLQRRVMQEAGISTPRWVEVPGYADERTAADLARAVTFPAILKPRAGGGSRNVERVIDQDHFVRMMMDTNDRPDEQSGWILESMLVGADRCPTRYSDVVSVESFILDGAVRHLAVTARFPLAEPFRETGSILPSDLPPAVAEAAMDVAASALRSLGLRSGCHHTELKLTDDGPRIIEVNGRIGGAIPKLLRLAGDFDIHRLAIKLALGIAPDVEPPLALDKVAFWSFGTPAMTATALTDIAGLDRLTALPGITDVGVIKKPNEALDWRQGLRGRVYEVFGTADTHDEVVALRDAIEKTVEMAFVSQSAELKSLQAGPRLP